MFLFLETVNLDVSDTKDVRRWWMVFALFVKEMATQVADGRFLIFPCLSRPHPHPCPPPSLEVLDHLLINLHVHLLVRLLDHLQPTTSTYIHEGNGNASLSPSVNLLHHHRGTTLATAQYYWMTPATTQDSLSHFQCNLYLSF